MSIYKYVQESVFIVACIGAVHFNIVDFDKILYHVLNVIGTIETRALETSLAVVGNIHLYFLATAQDIAGFAVVGAFAHFHVVVA
jgi:hypothetical protein